MSIVIHWHLHYMESNVQNLLLCYIYIKMKELCTQPFTVSAGWWSNTRKEGSCTEKLYFYYLCLDEKQCFNLSLPFVKHHVTQIIISVAVRNWHYILQATVPININLTAQITSCCSLCFFTHMSFIDLSTDHTNICMYFFKMWCLYLRNPKPPL